LKAVERPTHDLRGNLVLFILSVFASFEPLREILFGSSASRFRTRNQSFRISSASAAPLMGSRKGAKHAKFRK